MTLFRTVPAFLVRLLALDSILVIATSIGGIALDARWLAVALFHLWFLAELCLERRSGSSSSSEEDRGSRYLLTAVRDLCIVVPVALSGLSHGTEHPLLLPGGLLMFAGGMALRFGAMQSLGNRFTMSLTRQTQYALNTQGLYRHMRHPGYLGLLGIYTSFSLVCGAVGTGVVLGLVTVAALRYRIRLEEYLLVRTFGAAYLDYRARTWALVPRWAQSEREAA